MEYFYLFINALISATLFPLGSEALLLYDISQGLNIYFLIIVATLGNTLGSVINYCIGSKGEEYLVEKNLIKESQVLKSKIFFDKYGGYSLLLSWMPIIGDPITFIAGILHYDFKKFFFIVLFAKAVRYIFLSIGFIIL